MARTLDRTDGVPLFVEELTKAVLESGVLTDAGDHFTVTGPVAPLAIPTSLHASLLARLDRLSPVRELAQIGAALGRSFSHELISAVSEMPQQQLNESLAQLVNAEIIFRRGAPPDAEYTFKHALVQDAAYSTLLRSRRQQLQGRIATTLERRFPEVVAAHPGLMAQHCAEASMLEKAVSYQLKAGQQAVTRSALTEAVAQLQKGLDLLASLPDGTSRQQQELELQITLGQALIAAQGYSAPKSGEAHARARQLCDQLNQPLQLGMVLSGQFAFRLVRAELEQAEHHAEEMRQWGDARNDITWKCFGSAYSGQCCGYLGKFIDARFYAENALDLWNPRYRPSAPASHDPYLVSLLHLFRTLLCLGYVQQAWLRRNQALTEARRLSPYSLVYALCHTWYADWASGVRSAPTTLRSANDVLAISSEQGFSFWFGVGNIMRGWCLSAMGQAAEGLPLLLQGLDSYCVTGAKLVVPLYLMMLSEASGSAGQPKQGLDRIAEAIELTETTQERWVEAEMHRLRGSLLLSMNEHDAAEYSFRHALAVSQRQSAKLFELRAATSLGRMWRDQGKRSEARNLLAPVYGWFTEGFDTPVLQDAKVLLDELA